MSVPPLSAVAELFSGIRRSALFLSLMVAALPARADWDLNMPVGVTSQSQAIFDLHMLIFWICVALAALVYGVMFYALIVYRRRSADDKPAQFSHNTTLEWAWTLGAAAILVALAVPSIRTLVYIYDTSPGEINIKVIGYQWKWGYEYLEDEIDFISSSITPNEEIQGDLPKGEYYLLEVDNPIYIPVGRKVRFLITARDVLHAFWIPDFGIKQDAIPGFFNVAWVRVDEPGVYRGVCAELCGLNHGFMPIVVVAVEEAEYRDWVNAHKREQAALAEADNRAWNRDELLTRGEQVYLQQCAVCHLPTGTGVDGVFPTLVGSPLVIEDRDRQIRVVLEGVQGTAMQSFSGLLSPSDLAAVLTYTRSSWGNEDKVRGPVAVQPVEILERVQGR